MKLPHTGGDAAEATPRSRRGKWADVPLAEKKVILEISQIGPHTGVKATAWGGEDVPDPGIQATVPPVLCRAKLPHRAAPAISVHSVPPSPGPPGALGTPLDGQVEAWLPVPPEHRHLGVSLDQVTNNPSPALPERNVFAISQVSRCSACQTRAPASVSKTLKTHVTISLTLHSPSPKLRPLSQKPSQSPPWSP